jgi:hypothetical protein
MVGGLVGQELPPVLAKGSVLFPHCIWSTCNLLMFAMVVPALP